MEYLDVIAAYARVYSEATVVFAVLQLADIVSTNRFLRNGNGFEANPLMAKAQRIFGDLWVVPKLALAGAGYAALAMSFGPVLALWLVNAVYAYVVYKNWRIGSGTW